MSPRAATAALSPEFLEEDVTVRGITYHFRELSIGEYDDLVKKATKTTENPITGAEDETIDNNLLLKLMVLKSCTNPHLTPETLAALPMRATLRLNQTVNRMHYGDEPVETKDGSNGTGEEAEEEEEAKGEG